MGFLGDFEDLENVSEMVAETSETSKDQQSEIAIGENNARAEFAIWLVQKKRKINKAKVLPVKTTRARARVAKSSCQRKQHENVHVQNL